MLDVSKISSRGFCIGKYTYHRHVYLLYIAFIFTVFQRLIYFCQSVCTSFRLFCIPVDFFIRSVRFGKICDEIILRSTSEASIWFLTVMFITTLIIRVAWIEGWFLISLILSPLLKSFLSWVWTSTVTALLLRNFFLSLFLT